MSEQSIQSNDISVGGVFRDFYVVPDYQREYVWGTEEVEQLLTDIHGEMGGGDTTTAPEYFIGSIVVCPGRGGTLELIDGQQRMSTLFLILCAMRDALTSLGSAVPGALGPQIAAVSTDAAGNDEFRYRLDLQYADSGGELVRIAKGEATGSGMTTSRSISNIRNAYDVIQRFLQSEVGGDATKVRALYGYLTNKVKLIRIQTQDVAKALKIFETINDRGVGLDAMDLLKNLLFMKSDHAQFDRLKDTWKQMQDTIQGMHEKPLRFLRYFIFSRYQVDVLREDEIYGWLSRNEAQVGYATSPVAFADELLVAARAYRSFLDGANVSGTKNRYLENLRLLGGKSARQHLILLLAGRHLSPSLFDRLAREVEELFFVYVITREPTREFERNFARWATELRAVTDEATFAAFVERRFTPAKANLSTRFDDAFRRLHAGDVQAYRLRYILAKLTQVVEISAYGENERTRWLGDYVGNGFEIEHIHPQNASVDASAEFGGSTNPNVAQRLGNLVLVEKSINASLGNNPFSAKRLVYPKSQLLLTQAVATRPSIGVNTKIDKAVAGLEPFERWNETAVERRQAGITHLARRAWNIP